MKFSERTIAHRLVLGTLCLLGVVGSCLSDAPATAPESGVAVAGSQVRVMRSNAGRTYRIYVWAPSQPAPPAGRPVIYVLDGETTFMLVRDAARSLAASYPGSDLPVIVALAYDNAEPYSAGGLRETNVQRTYDYTPAVAKEKLGASFDDQPWPPTGGAAGFLDFIQRELKPAIEADFPIDRGRQTLLGHSFGGLFTLDAFFNCAECFTTYVASSPSVWYGSRYIEQVAQQFVTNPRPSLRGKRLLITVGELEQTRVPERGERARAEWLAHSRMVDGNRELAARLQSLRAHGLDMQFRVFEGESHLSVKAPAANYGVRFAMAQTPSRYPAYTIPQSAQWTETIGQEDHSVTALFPAFPASKAAPPAGYPVVYVLGAGQKLGVFADTLRRLEGGGMIEPTVLIGLDEPALLATIHQRVVSHLKSRYAIDESRRMLIGYGADATAVLQSLYAQPALFETYAVLSPPTAAVEHELRKAEQQFAATFDGPRKRLLLAAGDAAVNDFPGALQGNGNERTAGALKDLLGRLQPLQTRGLDTELRVFPAEDNIFSTTAIAEALLFELEKSKKPIAVSVHSQENL